MANDMNEVRIAGNITKDPEVRTAQNQKIVKFTVATNQEWKNKSTGEKEKKAEFHPVVAFGYTAEYLAKYVHKGDHILVSGRLSSRDFDDPKTGQHRWVTEVIADHLYEHHSKSRASDGNENGNSRQQTYAQRQEEFPMDFSNMRETGMPVDIPF